MISDEKPVTSATTDGNTFVIRPNYKQKLIHQVLVDRLKTVQYDPESASKWTKEIADEVRNKIKELDLPRYKIAVSVTLGENRGEGARMACKCLWDADADGMAQDTLVTDSLFCVVAVFGVFYY
ncbi:hypothetical protein M427DRAFT_475352 [Gonapodya prolifera JEL478]|uniref:Tctex1 domain-containing protein 2 n=1 Tax=Gonapodya prolifera (strain JEL478) TaxID=1344416 RepID=A0A139A1Y7_GONPJ|nr:hypothetical protein M427DRAFT_475352 [Gonapodya prolifera JEL478]|eukprot:KXS10555.1 hypothetical protein M427DRAFT_475352 [Gonapodya prolifera JEL478]